VRTQLVDVLEGRVQVQELLAQRRRRPTRVRRSATQGDPKVSVTNSESDFYTIADIVADDRAGLLHDLTEVIADHGLEIYISKAATVLDQVSDTFYLKNAEGQKIYDEDRLSSLRRDLLAAVSDAAVVS